MSDAEDDDLLAAEYVLGTLDASERTGVAARLGRDNRLASAVEAWQWRLSPLSEASTETEPPRDAYERLAERLFGTPRGAGQRPGPPATTLKSIERRLRRWQVATGAFAALAAALVAWIVLGGRDPIARPDLVAVLRSDPAAPAILIGLDAAAKRLTIHASPIAAPSGRDYELWIIDPSLGAPRSLGIVPSRGERTSTLGSIAPSVLTQATYAVTVEAPGGSPSGKPSGTPVVSGKIEPPA